MKKKLVTTILALALVLAMCFVFAACNKDPEGTQLKESMSAEDLQNIAKDAKSVTLIALSTSTGTSPSGEKVIRKYELTQKISTNAHLVYNKYSSSDEDTTDIEISYSKLSGDLWYEYLYFSGLDSEGKHETERKVEKTMAKYVDMSAAVSEILTNVFDIIEKTDKGWKIRDGSLGEGSTGSVSFSGGNLSIKMIDIGENEGTTEYLISGINATNVSKPSELDGMKESDATWSENVSYNNLSYQMNDAKTGYYLNGGSYGPEAEAVENLVIEGTINTLPVVRITTSFTQFSALKSVVIPASVSEISYSGIFSSCANLTIINCGAASQPAGWNANWIAGCDATVVWGYTG